MQTVQFQTNKTIEELRKSSYHKQLGRNVCAAFIAQQQGIRLDTAHKKIEEPIGDLWLLMAEIIRQQCFERTGYRWGLRRCGRNFREDDSIAIQRRQEGDQWRSKSTPTPSPTQ